MKTPKEQARMLLEEYLKGQGSSIRQRLLIVFTERVAEIQRDAREGMVEEHEMRPIVGRLCDCYLTLENLRAKHPNLFTK